MDPIFCGQVRHLYEVERLSMRQIAKKLGVSKKRVSRIIRNEKMSRPLRESILKPYERLIDQWYQEYPFLKASQVYERLKAYEFKESYCTVSLYTQKYRQKKRQAYHELTFLPGEVAQIDWMEVRLPWGVVFPFICATLTGPMRRGELRGCCGISEISSVSIPSRTSRS